MAFVPLLRPPEGLPGPHRWFLIRGSTVFVTGDGERASVPETHIADPPPGAGPVLFLGVHDGTGCWAAEVSEVPDGHLDGVGAPGEFVDLRAMWGRVPDDVWTVAGRAVQIVDWERSHRYCGRCGTPTVTARAARAKECPACGLLAFPRLAPAVIMLVEREGEALLARGRNWPLPMYSTLAGFVEPGETLEEAVVREVREEVGVELGEVRYFSSQPWPFPHSLMIGFVATWARGEIHVDDEEISDAAWFTPDNLPVIPPPMSIARRLIDDWRRRSAAAHGRRQTGRAAPPRSG